MKKNILTLIISAILAAVPFILNAQEPPHPNNGGAPGPGSNTTVGGGAPICEGISILLALGAMYAGKRVFHFRQKDE